MIYVWFILWVVVTVALVCWGVKDLLRDRRMRKRNLLPCPYKLAIVAVLLLSSWGLAGAGEPKQVQVMKFSDGSTRYCFAGVGDEPQCFYDTDQTCHAKMQEAMRYMNDFVQREDGYIRDNWRYPQKTDWNETMRECVEGKS